MAEEIQDGYYTVTAQMKIVTKPGEQLPCKRHVENLVKALLMSPPAQFTDARWDVHEVDIMTQWVDWDEPKKETDGSR